MIMKKFLLIGLGNVGNKYNNTRHNAGFIFIDNLFEYYKNDFSEFIEKKYGYVSEGILFDSKFYLIKPNTLMNLSGKAAAFFNKSINPDEIIVIHDDLDISLGKFKLKIGGSSAGHNGIKSISDAIGKDYYRLKVGIDRPLDKMDIVNYVLGKFSNIEYQIIFSMYNVMYKNLELLMNQKEKFVSRCISDMKIKN